MRGSCVRKAGAPSLSRDRCGVVAPQTIDKCIDRWPGREGEGGWYILGREGNIYLVYQEGGEGEGGRSRDS